jgi:membrane-associated phospholipid phosphatase
MAPRMQNNLEIICVNIMGVLLMNFRKVVSTLLLSFSVMQSGFAQDYGTFRKDDDFFSYCSKHDCSKNQKEIDINEIMDNDPYSYTAYEKSLYSCVKQKRICSQDEMQKIQLHEASLQGMSAKDFSNLVSKNPDPEKPSYFIPLSLTKEELILLAAGTSLGLVVFNQDQELMDFVQDHKTVTTEKITSVGNLLGREAILPIVAGSYFLGVVLKDGKLKQVGLLSVAAGLAAQIVTEGFKVGFSRKRPIADAGPYAFYEKGNKSFFSGHSVGAFSLATVIAETYKDNKIIPYVAYGLATLTAYSRMHDRKHWATDVLAGAIMGHLITKATIRLMNNDSRAGGFQIYPSINPMNGDIMVNLEYSEKEKERPFKCATMPDGDAKVRACIEEAVARSDAKKKLF